MLSRIAPASLIVSTAPRGIRAGRTISKKKAAAIAAAIDVQPDSSLAQAKVDAERASSGHQRNQHRDSNLASQ